MGFFENIAGFLFRPYIQCNKIQLELKFNPKLYKESFIFIIYSCIIPALIFIFWVFYPECLYYGVSFNHTYRNLLFINLSTPLNLLIIFCFILIILIIISFSYGWIL